MINEKEMFLGVDRKQVVMEMIECQSCGSMAFKLKTFLLQVCIVTVQTNAW